MKLAEHSEFFYRAHKHHNLKITYTKSVFVDHKQVRNAEYNKFRQRGYTYGDLVRMKMGVANYTVQ